MPHSINIKEVKMDKDQITTVGKTSKKVKVISAISYVLLTLAIILCAVTVFQIVTQGYVNYFGYSLFRVVTPSMEPEIPVGSFIISKKVNISEIQMGDVISFVSLESYMNGSVVTHRVVDIKKVEGKTSLVTRGDANNSVDGYYVTEDNLVGKVVHNSGKENFLVTVYKFVTQKHVFFLIVILPMLITAVCLLRNGMATMREEIMLIKQEIQNKENSIDSDDESENNQRR